MLTALLIWLGLDVAALCIVLYDYWRWYGRTDVVLRAVWKSSRDTFRQFSRLATGPHLKTFVVQFRTPREMC
jgi:hypothetical protein